MFLSEVARDKQSVLYRLEDKGVLVYDCCARYSDEYEENCVGDLGVIARNRIKYSKEYGK